MNTIPICAITDEKYPFALATMFVSSLENAKSDTFYKFYCFITGTVKQEDRDKILSIQNLYPKNCSVELIDMGDKYLDELCTHKYVTNACWYKFSIIEKILQHDKILYIDTDAIVRGDLTELFDTDLGDNYIAGVISAEECLIHPQISQKIGIKNLNTYINAGIMLMNLKILRDDCILEKLEILITNFPDTIDQDIFNKVCYGRILTIEPKFNLLQKVLKIEKNLLEQYYDKNELNNAIKSPTIFHYVGPNKPWIYSGLEYEYEWNSYYKKTPYAKIKLRRKSILIKSTFEKITKIFKKIWNKGFKRISNKICKTIKKRAGI